MAVEVIDVSEGLSTGLTGVILPHLVSVRIGNGIWILSSKNGYYEALGGVGPLSETGSHIGQLLSWLCPQYYQIGKL